MESRIRIYNRIAAISVFIVLPSLLLAMGESQDRSLLKESISYLTILSFCLLISQFFLARSNINILRANKMSNVVKIHKIIGYISVSILIFHPFLIVLPRYFESGVKPLNALTTIITSFNSPGILLGIASWCLLFIIGITSILRNHLGLKYKVWRVLHGTLSIIFILLASWHVSTLGRHSDSAINTFIWIATGLAVFLLLKTYFNQPQSTKEVSND